MDHEEKKGKHFHGRSGQHHGGQPRAAQANQRKTVAKLKSPAIEALAKAANLDEKTAAAIKAQIDDVAKWIDADPARADAFRKLPLKTLCERLPQLCGDAEADLGEQCGDLPPPVEYAACVLEILRLVAAWVRRSPQNRAVFRNNPDAAVDAAAPTAPPIAVAVTKLEIRTARTQIQE